MFSAPLLSFSHCSFLHYFASVRHFSVDLTLLTSFLCAAVRMKGAGWREAGERWKDIMLGMSDTRGTWTHIITQTQADSV